MSSSAQLVLLPWLLGWEQPGERTAFAAALHAGSCLGIGWALRDDLRRLGAGEALVLAAVSVPAAAAGAVAADAVEERLGRPPQLAALLAVAGAVMWWVDVRAERPAAGSAARDAGDAVPPRAAAAAALAQVVALVPGVSRSGAALTALRACGVDRAAAERFSLLMSLPISAGAAALTLARSDRATMGTLAPALAAGVPAAAAAAALTATRRRAHPGRPLTGAAVYRAALAAVVAHRLVRKGAP